MTGLVRRRLARSIDPRVSTATVIAADGLRADLRTYVDALVAGPLAEQERRHDELAREIAECGRRLHELLRRQEDLTARIDAAVRTADDDRDHGLHLRRELADDVAATSSSLGALSTRMSATCASMGSISASLTDAQRRQGWFVEQLVRRLDAVERSLPGAPRTPTEMVDAAGTVATTSETTPGITSETTP